ncbi:MAG: hypothetical protein R6W70_08715, partial [bacterium]
SQESLQSVYRMDYYFPNSVYNENTDEPVNGRRFHISGISDVTGTVTDVFINEKEVSTLLVKPKIEWYHVWPREVKKGEPVWFAFHSHDPDWNDTSAGKLRIETDNGEAVNENFSVHKSTVSLSYVTTTDDMNTMLIHIKNTGNSPQTLENLYVNGKEVYNTDVACIPEPELLPEQTALWTVPLCEPAEIGSAWTVTVEFNNADPTTSVGRIIKPFYPVESWPKTSNCPFPGVNDENFQKHTQAGFDTFYMYRGGCGNCSCDTSELINVTAPSVDNFSILIGDDFLHHPDPELFITDSSGVAGFLTGDESDGNIWDDDYPRPAKKASEARQLWSMYPELPVYNGAKTNKYVGSFAGMTDIQGIDLYVAACAPHITSWGNHPPLRAAYDYLKNTRNNHMPLPTWMYAQGLSTVWNKDGVGGGTIHVQPDPQEILLQALSVVAAGGKGMMWFQTDMGEADYKPERWEAISASNRIVRAVRHFLRRGDITGSALSENEVIVEAIRSERAIIIPVLSLKTDPEKDPTDVKCGASLVSEATVPHWIFEYQEVDVDVIVPDSFGIKDMFEVTSEGILDLSYGISAQDRTINISGIALDNMIPVRLIVFAADEDVRNEMNAEIEPFLQ